MATFNFGITPTYSFEDVSATVAGEEVSLSTVAYDYTSDPALDLTISFDALNACVTDVAMTDSDMSALAVVSGGVDALDNDTISLPEGLIARLRCLAENSTKATIAYAITGNEFGDIGELENDETLSGANLFDAVTFKAAIVTAMQEVNGDAIVSVAEDIVRNLGLSDGSGTDTGRNTYSPFADGDRLFFNMLIANGAIDIAVDGAHASVDGNSTKQNVNFFTGPATKHPVGLGGFTEDTSGGRTQLNGANGDNRYLDGVAGADRIANADSLKRGEAAGYNSGSGADGDFTGGSILVRFSLTTN